MIKFYFYILAFIFFYSVEAVILKSQISIKASTSADPNEFTIDNTKNNSVIKVSKKTTIHLNVTGNPTTGYLVYLKNYDSIDKTALKFTNIKYDFKAKLYTTDDYIPSNTDPRVVGSGGYFKFDVNVLKDFDSIDLIFVELQSFNPESETEGIKVTLTTSD